MKQSSFPSGAPEQTARPPEQNRHRERVDEEGAELRRHVFESRITNAYKNGCDERAANAAEAADRDHDEEIDQIVERIARQDGQKLRAQRAAERRQSAAERERDREQPRCVDPDGLRHAKIIDGGTNLRAEARALEAEPQRGDHNGAASDNEASVRREFPESEMELAAERRRRPHRLRDE